MKNRILSLSLCLCLLCGLLVLPAQAASPADVYQQLRSVALAGYHDEVDHYWADFSLINEDPEAYFGVYYWEQDYDLELSIFTDAFEVTLVLRPEGTLPYTAYIRFYDANHTTGEVQVTSSYNGGAFSSFSSFSGDTGLKTDMLQSLSELLPLVVEFTRMVLHESGYSLADMGLAAFSRCTLHVWNDGVITQQPTCTVAGVKTYTCVFCGAQETESVDPTWVHTWGNPTVLSEPSCTGEGLLRYTCTVCGAYTNDMPIPALGHSWTFTEAVTQGDTLHESTGKYVCSRCGETKEAVICALNIFTDVPMGHYSHDPVDWAYFHEPQITAGVTDTSFAPNDSCTRAQVVTFLWRAAGKPELSEDEEPQVKFTDVKETGYYYKAMLWALKNGVTNGVTDTTFAPNGSCTRAQVVTFLWRAAGMPELEEQPEVKFTDVEQNRFYYTAMLWAVGNGITVGMTDTTFEPDYPCTRAQVVTFLWRARDFFTQPEEPTPLEPTPLEPTPVKPVG